MSILFKSCSQRTKDGAQGGGGCGPDQNSPCQGGGAVDLIKTHHATKFLPPCHPAVVRISQSNHTIIVRGGAVHHSLSVVPRTFREESGVYIAIPLLIITMMYNF